MRIQTALLSLVAFFAIATPLQAQTTYGHVNIADETDDGVPDQVNTPQGLVVISHLVGNGVSMLVENRSWQRLSFSQMELDAMCVYPDGTWTFVGGALGYVVLVSTETAEAHYECPENTTATRATVAVTGTFPSMTARSRPIFPSNSHMKVAIADYQYDNIPVQVNEANNVQLEAYTRNRSSEFRIRNRSNIPIRMDRVVLGIYCGAKRPPGMSNFDQGDIQLDELIESTATNERWINAGQTWSRTMTCPNNLLAKSAILVTTLD